MQIFITIALLLIGILFFELIIFSHEFGHFITAKLSGVKVNEFALGMGPKLFGFTKGETTYTFRLLPIGGYCAMEGEDEDSENPRAFNNAKIWKRMIIIIAGAVMNILLGFILMFAFTVQEDSFASTKIEGFSPNAYTANTGLQVGDEIIGVNGYSVWNSRDMQFGIATLKCHEVDGHSLNVFRQDCMNFSRELLVEFVNEKEISDEKYNEAYKIFDDGCVEIRNSESKEDAKSKYEKLCSDLCTFFGKDNYEIKPITEQDVRKRFTGDITVIRDGKEVLLEDVYFYTQYLTEEDQKADKPSIAFDFYVEEIDKSFSSVMSQTFTQTCSMAKSVWTSLVWLVQGQFSFADLSGPVGIASAVTQVASQGLMTGFGDAVNNIMFVMILITINLGIVNMLPFPALDGGRFLFLLIEWIFRKPIPRKVEQIVNTAGLILLLLFMAIISLKDIWQLITGTMPTI